MKKPAKEQLKLDLGEDGAPNAPRSKRRRFEAPAKTDRVAGRRAPPRPDQALLQTPALTRCGFCGRRVTILQDAAVCPECGSIVTRDEE